MSTKRKPVVGETPYSLNVGNAASRYSPQVLTPVVVTLVGRKYFTCKEDGRYNESQYRIEYWRQRTDYSPTSVLYESREKWETETRVNSMLTDLKRMFEWSAPRPSDEVISAMHACIYKDKS